MNPTPRRSAFTLIELLVVITIIVVLISIMLPGLERAIAAAEKVKCAATLRSWSQGMSQYAYDNKQSVVQQEYSRGNFWFHRLAPYMGQPGYAKDAQPVGNKIDDPLKSNLCPTVTKIPGKSTEYETTANTGTADFALYGTVDMAWSSLLTRGSYAWNNALSKYSGNTDIPIGYYGKYTAAPGDTPLIADGIWVDIWPQQTDDPTIADRYNGDGSSSLGRICFDRHDLAVNLSYVDGSAGTVKLGDLWVQRWHSTFVPKTDYQGDYFPTRWP